MGLELCWRCGGCGGYCGCGGGIKNGVYCCTQFLVVVAKVRVAVMNGSWDNLPYVVVDINEEMI
eukprot:8121104-Ditylum_brightwellii.AAC.1